jgi:hypothetical protein
MTSSSANQVEARGFVLPVLTMLLVLVIALGFVIFLDAGRAQKATPVIEQDYYLSAEVAPQAQHGFRLHDVPKWLFVHVTIIAALQITSLIAAAAISQDQRMTKGRAQTVLFLIEIPMYLGLFGTLLVVSLEQFITGSLVAPLAYITTMSGILLHVFGKLAILLPLADSLNRDE